MFQFCRALLCTRAKIWRAFFCARTRALGQKAANREGIGTYDENSAMFCHALLLGSFFCWCKRNPGEFVDLECTYETLGYKEVGDQDFE